MNDNQKWLLMIGAVLTVVSAVYLSIAGVPNTQESAMAFPLSILGFFFGIGFMLWSLGWMLLEKTEFLQ